MRFHSHAENASDSSPILFFFYSEKEKNGGAKPLLNGEAFLFGDGKYFCGGVDKLAFQCYNITNLLDW